MYCHQCGTDNSEGAVHCQRCGHVFGESGHGPSSLVEMSTKFKKEPAETTLPSKFLRSMAIAFAVVGLLTGSIVGVLVYGGYLG